jgi:hypothetical protein
MRKNTQSAADDADTADGADESFNDVRIEAIASSPFGEPDQPDQPDQPDRLSPERPLAAPGWTKRRSMRGKLARALVVALVVLVALIVVLPHTSFTLPEITRLLTPAPTQTRTPGRLSVGQLEQIPTPTAPNAVISNVTPSPRDPDTAYTCMVPTQPYPATTLIAGEISLWVTQNAGQSWSRVALPGVTGTYCYFDAARDGSPRMVMNVVNYALDNAQPCAHDQYFLSEDQGATWRAIQHTTLALAASVNGACYLWATARHLFMSTFLAGISDPSGASQEQSFLERSDDGGRTWQRADRDLGSATSGSWSAQPLDATGETLFTFITDSSGGVFVHSDLWMTHDAGASWRRVESAGLPTPTKGGEPISNILTEAGVAGGRQACHCVFGVSYPAGFDPTIVGQHLYLSRDLTHWTLLPPIPAPGTSAERSGVYQLLGMTADGRLLVVGANPQEGVPDPSGQVNGLPPAFWAWNTHTGRWEVAPTRIPCGDLQNCSVSLTGVSAAMGTSGGPVGTYLWVNVGETTAENGSPYYRLSIPAA